MADAYSVILTLPSWVAKDNLAPPIHRTEQEHENDNIDREIAELGRHEPHSTTWKRLIREMRNTPRKLVLGTGQLAEQYQFEKEDRTHRLGDMLKLCFEAYTRRFPDDEEGIHFYEWLDALPNHELVPILKQNVNVYDKGVLDWHMIVNFKRGVQYMDKETRRSYKIDFWGGTAFRGSDGKEFDTSQNETAFSG